MPVRTSSSKQIDALIASLGVGDAVAQETAVARLTVLGSRAVERLLAATIAGETGARVAAWRALEAIGDPRALEPALGAVSDAKTDPAVGVAAAGGARVHLRGPHGARAVDQLATVLLDRARTEDVRLAALRALRELDDETLKPILMALAGDTSKTIRAEAGMKSGPATSSSEDVAAMLARAADGGLPDDPDGLRHAISRSAGTIDLQLLLRIVERVREREGAEAAASRGAWTQARAAAHIALAQRGSRIALYDLRESIETAKAPLPVEFLTALALIGDASCVEAIAGAHAKAAKAKDAWWRHHLADVFYAIVQRERLTSRHAVMKRIAKKSPNLVAQ